MGRRTGRRGKDDDYETKGIMHWQWLAGLRTGKVLLAYWQPAMGLLGTVRVRKKGSACKKEAKGSSSRRASQPAQAKRPLHQTGRGNGKNPKKILKRLNETEWRRGSGCVAR